MKNIIIKGLVALCAMHMAQGHASVNYSFSETYEPNYDPTMGMTIPGQSITFDLQLPDFVTQDTHVSGAQAGCWYNSTACQGVDFYMDSQVHSLSGWPMRAIAVNVDNWTMYYYFEQEGFSSLGVHPELIHGSNASLKVSAVPEPSAWLQALAGGVMVAGMIRRRRKAAA